MIVVRVELWSAITGEKSELARMHICNVGGSARRGNYEVESFVGRSSEDLDKRRVSKSAEVNNYPRLDFHVWNLVTRALTAMGYTK